MRLLVQAPDEALAVLKTGKRPTIAAAIGELCRLGAQPNETQLPHGKFKDGFSHFFAKRDIMPTLVSLVQDSDEDAVYIYLECIIDLLYSAYDKNPPPPPTLGDQFVEAGGVEMLRHSGGELLQSENHDIQEVSNAIFHFLVSVEMWPESNF